MDAAESLGVVVGQQRAQRGWTLDAAAARLGISRRLLVQIEQGEANPSLSTMLAVAGGFGIDLADLLDGDETGAAFVGPNPPKPLWSTADGSTAELAAAHGPLELWRWEVQPGESRSSEAHASGSRECIHVQSGQLSVEVGAEAVVVRRGEAVAFAADRPHRYSNHGRALVVFTLAVYDPIGA